MPDVIHQDDPGSEKKTPQSHSSNDFQGRQIETQVSRETGGGRTTYGEVVLFCICICLLCAVFIFVCCVLSVD